MYSYFAIYKMKFDISDPLGGYFWLLVSGGGVVFRRRIRNLEAVRIKGDNEYKAFSALGWYQHVLASMFSSS